MNLYLISNPADYVEYDHFHGAVVCADSYSTARMIHPAGTDNWDGISDRYDGWVNAADVTVKEIGLAHPSIPAGVVLDSFNAG